MLLHKLPQTVVIGDTEFDINSDFRVSIEFERLLFDSELSKAEALIEGLALYYPVKPPDEKEALEKILWFYRCGKPEPPDGGQKESKRLYSLQHDFDYIYAAFLEQYKIDLTEADMHWWKFQSLFTSLNDCMFQRIVGYRAVDMKKLPAEERKRYKALKRAFALPHEMEMSKEDRAFQEGLEEALISGNVSEFLKENQL